MWEAGQVINDGIVKISTLIDDDAKSSAPRIPADAGGPIIETAEEMIRALVSLLEAAERQSDDFTRFTDDFVSMQEQLRTLQQAVADTSRTIDNTRRQRKSSDGVTSAIGDQQERASLVIDENLIGEQASNRIRSGDA